MRDNWKVFDRKCDDIILQLLDNRQVDHDKCDAFLNPDFKNDLLDSSTMPDFDKFKSRIAKAYGNKEKIGIFADYDADGIPGAAFLHRALTKMGLESETYIPCREEGYGLSKKGVDSLKKAGCSLIITVDLGIRNFEEAEYCRDLDIDLIITDHHLPAEKIPNALAVINPKLLNSKYPFKDLSGAGVIYKLIFGLREQYSELDEGFLKWNLDLIAISTISDVVPLLGENRVIAKYGLTVLQKSRNVGLQALYKASAIEAKTIGVYQVGYSIGPRLNAPGRLADAAKSFELLITEDASKAKRIAQELNDENEQRQLMMEDLIKEAEAVINKNNLDQNKIILVKGKWAKGIIGPSASRLAERYTRPVVILADDGKMITGSARSIGDINIFEILQSCSNLLEKCGGHSGAAGLSLKPEMYDKFAEKLMQTADRMVSKNQLIRRYKADLKLDFSDLTPAIINKMKELEPYGMGNPRPTFVTELAKLVSPKFVGSTLNHLSSYMEQQNKRIKSIYFNCPYDRELLKDDIPLDLLYSVDEEEWNGRKYLKINVVDLESRG